MSNVEKLMDKMRDTIRDDDQEKLLREFELETWKRGMRDAIPVAQKALMDQSSTTSEQDAIVGQAIETAIDRKCVQTWRLE